MARSDSRLEKERSVFSYSLIPRIYLDVVVIALVVVGNIYFQFFSGEPMNHVSPTLYLLLIVVLGVYDFNNIWRKPLRKVRFYESHFEVSGWNEKRTARYEDLEYLQRKKRVIGDFRSGSAVWFSVKDDLNDFMVPNRKVGEPKMELYSWLLQKNPKAAMQAK